MQRHRIMVIGSNVKTVQRVSSYCLKKNLEVFPYYGIPNKEEVALFSPHVFVLCLPIVEGFESFQPYILWSEQPEDGGLSLVTTPMELYAHLYEFLHI